MKALLFILLVFVGFAPSIGYCQIDSLKKELNLAIQDSTIIDLNVLIGWEYINIQEPKEALIFAEKAEERAKILQDPYRAEGVYKLKAFCYGDMNDRPTCLENHLVRVKILESIGEESKKMVGAYFETASVLHSQEQDDAAIVYYNKCKTMAKDLGFNTAYALALISASGIKEERGELEEAKNDLKLAIQLSKVDFPFYAAIAGSQLGKIYMDQDSLVLAEDLFTDALIIVEPTGYNEYAGFVYQGIGIIRLDSDRKQAIHYLSEAQKCWGPIKKNFYLQELYFQLANAYADVNADSANYFYKKHIALSKEVNTSDNNEQIADMEARYHNDKNQQEIVLLSKENELAELEKEKQSQVITIVLIGLCLVFVLAIFLVIKLKQNRKQNKLIIKQSQEVQHQKEIIEEKTTELLDSINYAKRIQLAALTDIEKFGEDFEESFVLYHAKDELSGDFYWKGQIEDGTGDEVAIIALGDCTGHGVPGALLSILGINYLNMSESSKITNTPAQVLDFLNQGIHSTFSASEGEFRDGMDIAVAAIDKKGMKLSYACAKNPIYIIRDEEIIVLKGDKHAIGNDGSSIEPIPYTQYEFDLKKDDLLYLFSDGYPDQFGGDKGKKMGYKHFKQLLLSLKDISLRKQKESLDENFHNWKGTLEQLDDVCVIGVKI